MLELTLRDLSKLREAPQAELMRREYSHKLRRARARRSDPCYFRRGMFSSLPVRAEDEKGIEEG